jgi:hypothetical protein
MLDHATYTPPPQPNKSCPVTVETAVAAWRAWSPQQRADFGQLVGVAEVWDFAICPAVINPTVITLVPEVVS